MVELPPFSLEQTWEASGSELFSANFNRIHPYLELQSP